MEIAIAACLLLLLVATTVIHYDVLRLLSLVLPALRIRPRVQLILVIIGAFGPHFIEILLYGLACYVLARERLVAVPAAMPAAASAIASVTATPAMAATIAVLMETKAERDRRSGVVGAAVIRPVTVVIRGVGGSRRVVVGRVRRPVGDAARQGRARRQRKDQAFRRAKMMGSHGNTYSACPSCSLGCVAAFAMFFCP